MKGIVLQLKKQLSKHSPGSSKLFGSPDVWNGFEWPAILDENNCYDLDFVAQVNCAELSEYDEAGVLPKRGILYFFYDFISCPSDPEDKNAARVLFYDGNLSNLSELMMIDEDGVDVSVSFSRPISFSKATVNARRAHLQMCYDTPDAEGYTVLLRLDSFSALNGTAKFNDTGCLLFLISPESLKKRDFSDIRVKHVYKEKANTVTV